MRKRIKDKLFKTEALEAKYVGPGEDIIPQTFSISQAFSLDGTQSGSAIIGTIKQPTYVFRTRKGEKSFPVNYFSSQPTTEENYLVEETSFLGLPISDTIREV